MRILAVIPARAGSKGIPNKNIRIIGGHPLIYYSIKNALASEYITEVVVTTDSPEVKIVVSQMGAKVKWRDSSLCGDAVTLDVVIADAVPEGDWDYIVTMQPTSPTLRASTLDEAIGYAVENDLDTVISAINAPHLSWGEKDGRKTPNYTERLNRQYLPPCYMETGAFVISKASVVTPKTRIGAKVDVYEVPEDESQDVDTFEDLRSVAATLDRQRVAIYVNGNNKRGIGHIYRALELADEFYVKPDIYYDVNQTDPKVFGRTTHNLLPVNGIAELFDRCKEKEYTVFINDILTTSIDYMIGLRTVLPNAEIVNFEDDGEGIFHCVLSYPTAPKDANLRVIETLKRDFPDVRIGFSDHVSPDDTMMTLATAYLLGAEVIEKHFTLDKSLPGNDHYHAGDPEDFKKAISNFEWIDMVLGSAKKTVLDCEIVPRREARRYLVLTRDIKAGEIINKEDLMPKRPGTGISPMYTEIVLGRAAKVDLNEDTVLTWDMI